MPTTSPLLRCDYRLPHLTLPAMDWAQAITVEFRPGLTCAGGKLLSGEGHGTEVHAASFLRRRQVVLESELLRRRRELRRILVHELFHFVWVRLGNSRRRAWAAVLEGEAQGRARGELGWSSEYRKKALPERAWLSVPRQWREYACESFCDTAAWRYAGLARHDEFTLAERWKKRRAAHFEGLTCRPLAL